MKQWILLVCISLVALRIGPVEAQAQCNLDGFSLGTLGRPDYWSVDVAPNLCVIPLGFDENNVTSCTVYFSSCKALPGTVCGGTITNSSTCQKVTINGATTHYYSIGDFRGPGGYEATGDANSVGFVTIREADNLNTVRCNGTYETTLTWTCDPLKLWIPELPNVTDFVQTVTKGLSDCYLEIEFLYDGACYEAPTLTPDICQLQPYDFGGLRTEDYWLATVPNEACYGEGNIACQMFVAFCQPVPPTIDPACYGAAACQVGTDSEGESHAYSMGQFKDSIRFVPNDEVIGGGFHMDVSNGSRPQDGRCNQDGIESRVVLSCNSSAVWDRQDLSGLMHVAYTSSLEPCEYTIFVQYYGACEPVGPIVGGDTPSPVGWILMGIFFFVVIVYFVVGSLVQYFGRGARGLEVIPNYEFWATFVMLVLEGCKFSLDIITCFQFDGTIKNPLKTPGKSGIDYDKI